MHAGLAAMSTGSRLGIIAGGGELPERLASFASASGRPPYVLGVSGFASNALVERYGGELVSIGEMGKHIRLLREAGCADVVFAGIVRRPDFSKLKLDMKGAQSLPGIIAAAGKGDDALLRAVIRVFEDAGFNVIGADEVCADLLAPAGPIGQVTPSAENLADVALGRRVVERLGELDIGQGAVCRGGVVLAVEAQEGTDEMLRRCAGLEQHESGLAGVLFKAPKPIQEERIDLPTIGVATIENAAAAGLAGVAVQAGRALVLNCDAVVQAADRLGLFVFGYEAESSR